LSNLLQYPGHFQGHFLSRALLNLQAMTLMEMEMTDRIMNVIFTMDGANGPQIRSTGRFEERYGIDGEET
jgi:hypothetical protein